jgi:hypothetical protein
MAWPKPSRRVRLLLGVVLVLALAGVVGRQLALQRLRDAITETLGPRSSVERIELGLTALQLIQLRVRAAPGWPAEDELRASRITVTPDLGSLFGGLGSGAWRLHAIRVEGGYLSLHRAADGRLKLLPALLEPAPSAPGAALRDSTAPPPAASAAKAAPRLALTIGEVQLADASVELFDASVRRPPHRLQLQHLEATVGPLTLPQAVAPTKLALKTVLKGPQRDGTLSINGRVHLATQDATLQIAARDVDLLALQPYLLKASEAGVKRGTLDLGLDVTVRDRRLNAPGTLSLKRLELSSGGGALASFAGLPRQAVMAAMQRDGVIAVRFTLDGRLDDPRFSLNEALAQRVAGGLANSLGLSLSGVVGGITGIVKGLFGK